MALALLLLLWLITLATAYLFMQSWLPAAISSHALRADQQLQISLAILGVVFVLAQVLLGWMVWRHRERSSHAAVRRTGSSSLLVESGSVIVAALLFLGMNLYAAQSWTKESFLGATGAEPIRVEVTGQQFRWYFRYPGPDGIFGAVKPELQDASVGNPLGLDPDDAAGADDRISAALVVAADRDVAVTLRSQDVIHSFFVPQLRLKQDAVPGMVVGIHFRAEKPGEFEVVCAELCGQGHHQMNAKLKVLPEGEFTRWMTQGTK